MRRMRVNKFKSAKKFRSQAHRAKAINFSVRPMRGGFRL